MTSLAALQDSLVLYKSRPARVLSVADKLDIDLGEGKVKRVRPKDVVVLHPGPLRSLGELTPQDGEVEAAWELLAGETTELGELTELVFGQQTPAASWAAWQLVAEGVLFRGTPDCVEVLSREAVELERRAREEKAAAARDWDEFIARLHRGSLSPQDARHLSETERLALNLSERSRLLRDIEKPETPESAHRLLVKCGYWDAFYNPYPQRLGVARNDPDIGVPSLSVEERVDLTHLPAFAIDDEGNRDPDDALSLDGDQLWVHVADVGALVAPGSDLDVEARSRGANLYLPEGVTSMLPSQVTDLLGLGLQEVSPALSFGMQFDAEGCMSDVRIVPSWVRVQRLSYEAADQCLHESPFREIRALCEAFRRKRLARGAVRIDLPEVSVKVVDSRVMIKALPRLESREMVADAMLMVGEAAARFAQDRGIPFPYATQPPPEPGEPAKSMSEMFASRRRFKKTQTRSVPAPHSGLGLDAYARVTSPLRRYLDLVAHQQLRAHLRDAEPLSTDEILMRIADADPLTSTLSRVERFSNRHWSLVYLLQNPDWKGPGVVVDKRERRATVLVPDLGLEARVALRAELPLDAEVLLHSPRVDLPDLDVRFRVD